MNENEHELDQVAALRDSIVALTRRLRQSTRVDSQTWTELMTLGAIERGQGRVTPTQIAAELELRSSNLAQILGALEARGLIRRTPDAADKRKVRLALTGDGVTLVGETRSRRDRWLSDAMAARLSPQERAQLLAAGELMQRLAQSSASSDNF